MNSKIMFTSLFAIALIAGGGGQHHVHAEEADDQGMMQQDGQEGELKAVEVGNKICPVSGNKVDEMGEPFKYEYNGKIYNLCCKMCVKDFKKDPEKYRKIAEEETKELQTDPHKDHNHNNS